MTLFRASTGTNGNLLIVHMILYKDFRPELELQYPLKNVADNV